MPPLAAGLVRASDRLDDVVRSYEGHGFPSQFEARPGGTVCCLSCRREHPARWVKLLAVHRVRSAGRDAVVSAVECPACEERGTLALTGSEADRLVLSAFALAEAAVAGPAA